MKKLIAILIICLLTGAATVNAAYKHKQKRPNFFMPQTALADTSDSNTTKQIQQQEKNLLSAKTKENPAPSVPSALTATHAAKHNLEQDYSLKEAEASMKQYKKDLQDISQGEKINNPNLLKALSKFNGQEHIIDVPVLK